MIGTHMLQIHDSIQKDVLLNDSISRSLPRVVCQQSFKFKVTDFREFPNDDPVLFQFLAKPLHPEVCFVI